MTLHIELEPQDLQVLEARAAALGVPVERAAADALREVVRSDFKSVAPPRRLKGFGAAAHLSQRAADINRERREEVEREESQGQARRAA